MSIKLSGDDGIEEAITFPSDHASGSVFKSKELGYCKRFALPASARMLLAGSEVLCFGVP